MKSGFLFASQFLGTGLAAALNQQASLSSTPEAFNLEAKIIGNSLDGSVFNAADSALFLRLSRPTAECDSKFDGQATFQLKDGGLYLYSTRDTRQQIFVQPSKSGLQKVGYTTEDQAAPTDAELTGWKLDASGYLTFNGAKFVACPRPGEPWTIWVSTDTMNAAVLQTCYPISAGVIEKFGPNSCLYSKKPLLRLY